MSILSCAHTHTQFCDGKTTAEEMARIASEKGFLSLGFSSHAPQTFDHPYCIDPEQEGAYREEILRLKKQYEGKMTIYLGLERDYFACVPADDYDYFIASVHYLPFEGGYAAVDGAAEDLLPYLDRACGGDGRLLVKRYYTLLRDYVLSAHPAIIGHFDLLRKNNARLHFVAEEDPACRRAALEALEAMRQTDALLEVNTGCVGKGYLPSPYPEAYLLSAWLRWGGEVIVNSDCHDGALLDCWYPQAEQLLRSLGYDHAVRLGKTQTWERFSL